MLVYRPKMCGRKHIVQSWGFCENCGEYVKFSSYKARKWGYFYSIPLLPKWSRIYVIKECAKCDIAIHIPLEQIPETTANIQKDIDRAVEALQAEKSFFILKNDAGKEAAIPCIDALIDAFEILHCIDRDDILDKTMLVLEDSRLYKEYLCLKGKIFEFNGKLDEAAAQYEEIIKDHPEYEIAYWLFGKALFYLDKFNEAREIYEKLLRISDNESEVMFQLISIYTQLNDFPQLAETYESCLAKHPELAQDKDFVENYKQACQNAGVEPRLDI